MKDTSMSDASKVTSTSLEHDRFPHLSSIEWEALHRLASPRRPAKPSSRRWSPPARNLNHAWLPRSSWRVNSPAFVSGCRFFHADQEQDRHRQARCIELQR
ncbi:hypothetical protein PC116_g1372 [Phytophthora cactorum]|nr:hypothetical protein PC114_g3056 [Phytophthora cactorum]KAG3041402.1 hypothetical protein PC119_g783 [Phytophthora cactorum]KAG3204940.1 hypothetical protein PC128_g1622 [Phytophthora cactorum]KAG4059052.1 hypothetical protein PC123_g5998 [Phytophthora cactorum]KAG4250923.1 hypothetical protein PC116_g1372 [Phytophthora cactorum]